MFYLAGDDTVDEIDSDMSGAIWRLERLSGNNTVRVVAQFDTAGTKGTRRFVVQPGGRYTEGVNQWSLGERNTGDPADLRAFTRWARENYPANHYLLIVAGHGYGTDGIAYDDSSPDPSSVPPGQPSRIPVGKLGEALTAEDGLKLDVVFYDSCLMGLFENAYEIKDQAQYLVVSQNISWTIFPYDRYLRQVARNPEPEQLAQQIVQTYANHEALNGIPGTPYTIAALNLNQADVLRSALDELAEALIEVLGAHRNEIAAARSAAQKFVTEDEDSDTRGFTDIEETDDYIDLYDFAEQISREFARYPDTTRVQTAAARVKAAVDGFVVAERHQPGHAVPVSNAFWNLSRARGVSVYFPTTPTPQPNRNWDWFLDYLLYTDPVNDLFPSFEPDSQWDDFVRLYNLNAIVRRPRGISRAPFRPPLLRIHLPAVQREFVRR